MMVRIPLPTSRLELYAPEVYPQTNIAPKNGPSQKETIVFQPSIFQLLCLLGFRGCNIFTPEKGPQGPQKESIIFLLASFFSGYLQTFQGV